MSEQVSSQHSGKSRGRLWLILLIALFVIPMLASWSLFFYTQKTGKVWGTSNKGVLLQPMVALKDFSLPMREGDALTLKDLETQWTLLYLMPENCDEQCEKDIFHMRQIHVSISKDFGRVQRLLVLQNPEQLISKDNFLKHYHDMLMATADDKSQPLKQQIIMPESDKLSALSTGHIFIVDPQANAIMVYEKGVDPHKVFKDLKKLLRMSRIG